MLNWGWNRGVSGVELGVGTQGFLVWNRGFFWCETEGCVELRGFWCGTERFLRLKMSGPFVLN